MSQHVALVAYHPGMCVNHSDATVISTAEGSINKLYYIMTIWVNVQNLQAVAFYMVQYQLALL